MGYQVQNKNMIQKYLNSRGHYNINVNDIIINRFMDLHTYIHDFNNLNINNDNNLQLKIYKLIKNNPNYCNDIKSLQNYMIKNNKNLQKKSKKEKKNMN
jgi:hypothetical protein